MWAWRTGTCLQQAHPRKGIPWQAALGRQARRAPLPALAIVGRQVGLRCGQQGLNIEACLLVGFASQANNARHMEGG